VNWAEIKQEARDQVHATMGVDAYYTPNGGVEQEDPITARLHQKSAFIGDDLDSDFSPGLLSQIDRVILDTREVPDPSRGDKLRFPDYQDVVIRIENRVWQAQHKVMCEVVVDDVPG
jgi:hypothetical protein